MDSFKREGVVNEAFDSGKEYVIFYRKGCTFSESALSDCDDNISCKVDISEQKEVYLPLIKTYFEEKNWDVAFSNHNTYPIIFRKNNNDNYDFVGGYTEFKNQKNIQSGGGEIQKLGQRRCRHRYVLTNIESV